MDRTSRLDSGRSKSLCRSSERFNYFLQNTKEFESGPTRGKGRQVDIGLIVFRLTVLLVDSLYLNRIVGHNVKILDFFDGIGKNSEKGISLHLVVELGLFPVELLPINFSPETI